jgi:hypothetical protein
MADRMIRTFQNRVLLALILLCSTGNSCAPKIKSFIARPYTTITAEDSVQLTWKVRGKPTLLVYEDPGGDDENPAKHYLSYKLVVQKGKKEVSYPILSLTVLPDTSIDYIIINTIRVGDSAVANAVRDSSQWGNHFVLAGLSSASGRPITVTHVRNSVILSANGGMSSGLNGLSNSGAWQLSTVLSAEEKMDSTRIPGRLSIKTIIVHKKH